MFKYVKDLIQGKTETGKQRSPHWPLIRAAHLLSFPKCAVCGGEEKVEVHHIEAFHSNPALELQLSNLISLCESKKKGINCHLLIGHLGCFRDINPGVIEDARYLNQRLNSSST